MKTALLAGSTGLIGSQLLELLLRDPRYSKVIAISRKPLSVSHHKLVNVVSDFKNLVTYAEELKCDDVFCCLGTTIRVAKTKEAFREVDFEYPLTLAKIARSLGAAQFFLVSSLGANKKSGIFYNQVKGEVEEAVSGIDFRSIHIFRPSLLIGPRTEHRSGEDAAKVFYKIFGFLIPVQYKSIESIRVARAMLAKAKEETAGKFIHESKEIQVY
jgi:uncharacterized protein YbjT (DUF2867 family)